MKLPKIRFPGAVVLAIAAGMSLATVPVKAANIIYTNCADTTFCTLDDLFFKGGSIQVDQNLDGNADKVFDTWTLLGSDQFPDKADIPAFPIKYDNIQVRAFSSINEVGLQYDVKNDALLLNPKGQPGQKGLQAISFDYSFNLKSINSWQPTNNTLGLTNATTTITNIPGAPQPSSGVSIEEVVTDTNGNLLSPQGSKFVSQDNIGLDDKLTDTLTFPGQSEIVVNNIIKLEANSPSPQKQGLAQIKQYRQTFSTTQVPESGTIMGLLVFGGLCLTIKRN